MNRLTKKCGDEIICNVKYCHPEFCLGDCYGCEHFKEIKTKFPNKDIWLYTGYTLSINDFDTSVDICWDNSLLRNFILTMCDIVVDGPYIEEQRDLTLAFRGSKNQRIIDVKKTLDQGEIILWNGLEN